MGRWTELWDEDRQKWVKVYVEWTQPLGRGTATTSASPAKRPTLYGPDERPLPPPDPKPFGFRKSG